jgi:hypothetical protein
MQRTAALQNRPRLPQSGSKRILEAHPEREREKKRAVVRDAMLKLLLAETLPYAKLIED